MDWSIIPIILLLIFLEGILSIDNAAVLGAMVAHLPADRSIEWPGLLRRFQHPMQRLFGNQQTAALKVGLLGAYLGRGLMLGLAFFITKQPWILVIGAGYLFWLGINHFATMHRHNQREEDASRPQIKKAGFWKTVLLIEIADLAFSLDNVVVAVQLDPKNRFWVIALGVGIGIVIMRFAATIFTRLIDWERNLEHAAFALLLAIGAETLLKAFFHLETPHWLKFVISMTILVLTVAMSRWHRLAWLRIGLARIGLPLAATLQVIFNWLFIPIRWLWSLLMLPFQNRKPKPSTLSERQK